MKEVTLRDPKPGDFGWIIHRQAKMYAEELSLNSEFEGLLAHICADFIKMFDPLRERAWVAELDGQVMGSVLLMRGDRPEEGKLRLLYVEPAERGSGVGGKLVTACIDCARTMGYEKLVLWTESSLSAARRLYSRQGFVKTAEQAHTSFGQELIGDDLVFGSANLNPPQLCHDPSVCLDYCRPEGTVSAADVVEVDHLVASRSK